MTLKAKLRQSAGPVGDRLIGNLGPGTLRPGAGKLVQRSGEPLYCGSIAGVAVGYLRHPNSKDKNRESTRFQADVIGTTYDGKIVTAAECYLPGTTERALAAALDQKAGPVQFAFEIWCEPDPEGRPASPLGYSYVAYNRRQRGDTDPVLALAYAAGILERPAPQLPPPDGEPEEAAQYVDPETGEVTAAPPSEAAEGAPGASEEVAATGQPEGRKARQRAA